MVPVACKKGGRNVGCGKSPLSLPLSTGGFLGACASFPAARQRLLDAFETYEQLLKDELESFSLLNTSNGCNFTFFIMFSDSSLQEWHACSSLPSNVQQKLGSSSKDSEGISCSLLYSFRPFGKRLLARVWPNLQLPF